MEVAGVVLSFILIMYLVYKKVDMGLSLFIGAVIVGLFSSLSPKIMIQAMAGEIASPVSLQLMVVVALISGLGFVLKETGDLDKMIGSLISLFSNIKILCMVLPALIGTLSVPGGAILSAPMVEESADKINLNNVAKTTINLFYRHIGYFIYPLYSPIILASELLKIEKIQIIKYNFLTMVVGLLIASYTFFKGAVNINKENNDSIKVLSETTTFVLSFLPILIILVLALVFELPFYVAVIIGVTLSLLKNPPKQDIMKVYKTRVIDFFKKGVKYNLVLVIAGVMAFKSVVEVSGAVNIIADFLTGFGIPLSMMIVILGFVAAFVTGMHVAALGLLLAIFTPLIPVEAMGVYVSLLFTSIFLGYLLSPIHLCMVLTKQYFKVGLMPVYRMLIIPSLGMLVTAVLQLIIFG